MITSAAAIPLAGAQLSTRGRPEGPSAVLSLAVRPAFKDGGGHKRDVSERTPVPVAPPFKEYKATISYVVDPLPDLRILRLALPEPVRFVPGQFAQVILDGQPRPSSFSIASSPANDREIELGFKIIGPNTNLLNRMRKGDTLTLRAPLGRFTFTAEDGDIVCLTGGIGITPFMSMARFIHDKKLPNKCLVIYSAKTRGDLVYFDELERLSREHQAIQVYATLTGQLPDEWEGGTSRIDAEMIREQVPDFLKRTYYVCGPKLFIDAMIEQVRSLGVPDERIKKEVW